MRGGMVKEPKLGENDDRTERRLLRQQAHQANALSKVKLLSPTATLTAKPPTAAAGGSPMVLSPLGGHSRLRDVLGSPMKIDSVDGSPRASRLNLAVGTTTTNSNGGSNAGSGLTSPLSKMVTRRTADAGPGAAAAPTAGQPLIQLTREQMSKTYEEWMKAATDNKINVKNSWQVALIDYFSEMSLLKEGDGEINFQKASCTLESCVKVYANRVDSVVDETGKLQNGLATGSAPGKTGKGLDADEEGAEADAAGSGSDVGKLKRLKQSHTLARTAESLLVKDLAKEMAVTRTDPLFARTCAEFDAGGAKGLLLARLGLRPVPSSASSHSGTQTGAWAVQFDTADAKPFDTDANGRLKAATPDRSAFDMEELHEWRQVLLQGQNSVICPSWQGFSFTSAGVAASAKKTVDSILTRCEAIPSHLLHANDTAQDNPFGGSAATYDDPHDDEDDEQDDDHGSGGFEDGGDDVPLSDPLSSTGLISLDSAKEKFILQANAFHRVSLSPEDMLSPPASQADHAPTQYTLLPVAPEEDEDEATTGEIALGGDGLTVKTGGHSALFSYFESITTAKGGWAGPEHYRVPRHLTTSHTSLAPDGSAPGTTSRRKAASRFDFESAADVDIAAMFKPPPSAASLLLKRRIPEEEDPTALRLAKHLLPLDVQYGPRDLLTLFMKPVLPDLEKKSKSSGTTSFKRVPMDTPSTAEASDGMSEEGWMKTLAALKPEEMQRGVEALQEQQHYDTDLGQGGFDDDGPVDDLDGSDVEDDLGALLPTAATVGGRTSFGFVPSGPIRVPDWLAKGGTQGLSYIKRAPKRVDLDTLANHLFTTLLPGPSAKGRTAKPTSFTELLAKAPHVGGSLPKDTFERDGPISLPYCFLALLQSANEHDLDLVMQDSGDIMIQS